MSRRKQAKPRALKREILDSNEESTEDTIPLTDGFCSSIMGNSPRASTDTEDEDDTTSTEGENDTKYRCSGCRCKFEDLMEFLEHHEECSARGSNGGIGGATTPPGSLRSLSCTPDDSMSDTPGSSSCCPTPSSSSGGGNNGGVGDPDAELSYTLGVTENTPYGCQFCDRAFPRLSYLKRHEQVHSDQMPFRCDYCHRLFKHKRSRDRHVKLHTGDRKYRCNQCESAFSRSDHLKIHMKTHDNGKPYQCTVCNRGYNTAAALSSHMQNHKKVFNLDHRNSTTDNIKTTNSEPGSFGDLQQQVAPISRGTSESPEPPKPLVCSLCPYLCTSASALKDHLCRHHQSSSPSPSSRCLKCREDRLSPSVTCSHKLEACSPSEKSPSLHGSPQPPRTGCFSPGQLLTCGICSRSDFPSIESLQLHVQVLHLSNFNSVSTTIATSPKNFKQKHQKRHLQTPSNANFVCDICGQGFASLQCLQKHNIANHLFSDMLSPRSGDIYCSQCNVCFTSSTALLEHVHLVHEPTVNHQSPASHQNSNKRPTSSSPRLRHNGSKHLKTSLGLRSSPLAIFNGGSYFKRQPGADGEFSSSRQTPTPPKSMSNTLLCNQCNAAFQDFESFRSHLKKHLDEAAGVRTTSNQSYSCPECDVQFDNERLLDCHVISHFLSSNTEYGCQSCVKLFQKPDDLQKHLLDIHAQHLYRCALCRQMFDSKVSIQVHFAVKHSNECRTFKCISCGAYFRTELEFQIHVKVSHLSTCHPDAKSNQPFRCLLCDQVCSGEAQLRFHVATHKKPFPCTLCSEAFHVEFLLDRHIQAVHQQTLPPGRSIQPCPPVHHPFLNVQQPQQQRNAHTPGSENCVGGSSDVAQNLCVKRTNNTAAKDESKPIPNAELNTSSPQVSTSANSNPTVTVSSSNNEHNCELCDSTFTTESALTAHKRQAHSMKNQQKSTGSTSGQALSLFCAYCNESCKSRHDLENHMKGHTGTPTRHKCNICDEVCPSATTLAEHKLTHCKVLSSSTCVVCRVPLVTEEDFMCHVHQHNGQLGLPGPCVVCRQTLVTDVEVQMHAKFHAKNSSVNPTQESTSTHGSCCVCSRQFEIGNLIIRSLAKPSSSDSLPHTYMCKECFHSKSDEVLNTTRCLECGVKFESECDLETHRRAIHHMRSNGKTYQCIKCQISFESEADIQAHVTCHVMQEGTDHECRLCQKVLDSPSKLQCHLIEHTFEGCANFTCYMCSSVFTGAHLLQQHMLEHGLDARPYDCTRCHHKFYFRAELENHSFVHQMEYQSIYQPTPADAMADGISAVCTPEEAKTDLLFRRNPFQLPLRSLRNVQDNFSDGPVFCKECNSEFPSYQELQHHTCLTPQSKVDSHHEQNSAPMLIATENAKLDVKKFGVAVTREKRHECTMCPKRFTRRENMRMHMKTHHNVVASVDSNRSCQHCGKTFTKRSALKDHMKSHNKPKSYPCEACQESFPDISQLKEHHKQSHGHHFEYECVNCKEFFETEDGLESHTKENHPVEGTKETEDAASGDAKSPSSVPSKTDPEDQQTTDEDNNLTEIEPNDIEKQIEDKNDQHPSDIEEAPRSDDTTA